jgi:hypothetical protein
MCNSAMCQAKLQAPISGALMLSCAVCVQALLAALAARAFTAPSGYAFMPAASIIALQHPQSMEKLLLSAKLEDLTEFPAVVRLRHASEELMARNANNKNHGGVVQVKIEACARSSECVHTNRSLCMPMAACSSLWCSWAAAHRDEAWL